MLEITNTYHRKVRGKLGCWYINDEKKEGYTMCHGSINGTLSHFMDHHELTETEILQDLHDAVGAWYQPVIHCCHPGYVREHIAWVKVIGTWDGIVLAWSHNKAKKTLTSRSMEVYLHKRGTPDMYKREVCIRHPEVR